MKSSMEKQYLKELKLEMGKMTDVKRAYMAEITINLREHIDNSGCNNIEDLYNEFGEPSTVAQQFIDINDLSELKKKARKYYVLKITAVVMALLIIFFTIDAIESLLNKQSIIQIDDNFSSTDTDNKN